MAAIDTITSFIDPFLKITATVLKEPHPSGKMPANVDMITSSHQSRISFTEWITMFYSFDPIAVTHQNQMHLKVLKRICSVLKFFEINFEGNGIGLKQEFGRAGKLWSAFSQFHLLAIWNFWEKNVLFWPVGAQHIWRLDWQQLCQCSADRQELDSLFVKFSTVSPSCRGKWRWPISLLMSPYQNISQSYSVDKNVHMFDNDNGCLKLKWSDYKMWNTKCWKNHRAINLRVVWRKWF